MASRAAVGNMEKSGRSSPLWGTMQSDDSELFAEWIYFQPGVLAINCVGSHVPEDRPSCLRPLTPPSGGSGEIKISRRDIRSPPFLAGQPFLLLGTTRRGRLCAHPGRREYRQGGRHCSSPTRTCVMWFRFSPQPLGARNRHRPLSPLPPCTSASLASIPLCSVPLFPTAQPRNSLTGGHEMRNASGLWKSRLGPVSLSQSGGRPSCVT